MNKLCKDIFEKHIKDLVSMDPMKVANELVKGSNFDSFDYETVLREEVSQSQNEAIVDIIQDRGLDGLSEFIRSLTSVNNEHRILAEKLQPVNFRILWLSTCPAHAASVVHVLKAKFSKMHRIGKDHSLILRRGRIFRMDFTERELKDMKNTEKLAKRFHEVEICLVFPAIEKDNLSSMFEEVFKEKLVGDVDLVVLGKTIDIEEGGNDGYVIFDAVTVDKDDLLRKGPTKDIPPQVCDLENVRKAVMHSKSYRKSLDSDATVGPKTEVLDFDSAVLCFYAMCSHYLNPSKVSSLACVSAKTSRGISDAVDVNNSLILKNIIRCYYDLCKNQSLL